MIRLFKHYVPHAVLLLGLFDIVLLIAAAEFGWVYRADQIGMKVEPIHTRIPQLLSFAASLEVAMVAVGVYGANSLQSLRHAAARILVAVSLGVILLSVIYFVMPGMTFWRSNLLYSMPVAVILLFALRVLLGKMIGGQAFKRRVVVLGAGARAARLKALGQTPGAGFVVVGYVSMSEPQRVIPEAIARDAIYNLADHVVLLNASEVVLALEERRNALPLKDLLRIKTTGVHVNEISTFLERETGRVDLQSVNPSWLIFSDGFSSGRMLSSIFKRLFDIGASALLLTLMAPVIILTAIAIKLESKGPAFYRQRRVGLYGVGFDCIKLRSMRQDAEVAGKAVWAEKDDPRITRIGRFIRKCRIDELPQTWSVLKGEMSFVGPRPERPQFVDDLEQQLNYYAERHMVKPGITGWAQINYPYGASIEDSRQKLEYDLYYAKNYSPFLDLLILLQTIRVVLWPRARAELMTLTVILWGHALAALLFCMIALSQLRDATTALPRLTFVVALIATALWALAVAGIDARDVTARVAESLRNLAWLGFMFALVRRDQAAPHQRAIALVYGAVVLIVLAGIAIVVIAAIDPATTPHLDSPRVLLRMMVAVSALVLVHHLYSAVAPRARGGIRLVVIALAAMWGMDFVLYGIRYATNGYAAELIAVRGVAMAMLAPLFAIAVLRNGDWTLRLSRSVAWQSLSLAGVVLYLLMMVLATSAIAGIGGENARMAQTAFVFGSTAATLTLVSSPWLKAWTKVKLAKHLFRHRYDYRAEWIRFTDTLGKPEGAVALDTRVVKAVADLTDSPAGLLLVPDGAALGIGAGWNWNQDALPATAGEEALARHLAVGGRIIELDSVRATSTATADAASVPQWMLDLPEAWALVPLVHLDRLQGAILLARPPVDRALDWEDFDLLRIAGRQVASYLAEARAQEALAEGERFDEFNRRFAFILHDIKNLVSQLTLTARNAERHADNPEFRADMIATLQDSAGRMNDLLARLSQHHNARGEELRSVEILPLVERVAVRRRAQHPVVTKGKAALAHADPVRLEQLLGHLLQNAIEASAPNDPVTIAVGSDGDAVTIDVIDSGCGMSPAFLRDKLFKPFVSSKPGGFGIGAFEARQLAQGMGGTVSVTSREGAGTHFRVSLAATAPHLLEQAA